MPESQILATVCTDRDMLTHSTSITELPVHEDLRAQLQLLESQPVRPILDTSNCHVDDESGLSLLDVAVAAVLQGQQQPK